MPTEPLKGLPDVHPGCPGSYRLYLSVRLVHQTDKAYLVESAIDGAHGRVWLSKSHAWISTSIGGTGEMRDGKRFQIRTMTLPVWLYRKVKDQF